MATFAKCQQKGNMRKVEYKSDNTIRFRRWSRKAYSIFASLHRHVTIGQVCNSITDASMSKSSDCMCGFGILRRDENTDDSVSCSDDTGTLMSMNGMYLPAENVNFAYISESRCGAVPCDGEYIRIINSTKAVSVCANGWHTGTAFFNKWSVC